MATLDNKPDNAIRRELPSLVPPKLGSRARWFVALFGAASFAAGTAAVFAVHGNGGAGAAALLAVGAVAVALGGLGVLPTGLKVGGVEVSLPEQVQRLAEEAGRQGRPDLAAALQVSADLAATAEPFTQVYESVRRILPSGRDRTLALQALVNGVEGQARAGRWSPAEASVLFASGHEGARVFALAMVLAFPRRQELHLAIDAAVRPKSDFEQYQALVIINRMVPQLSDQDRTELRSELANLRLENASDREIERDLILEKLAT